MKYFKLVNAPTWKIPQYMKGFLFICTRHRVRYLQLFFAICDSLMLCKVHCFGKRWFFHEIFQVGACPNLKDSLIYENFSIHLYKTYKVRYLQLLCAICDSLLLCKVHYFGKRWFFMKYFKLVHAPTWKIPFYMKFFLFIPIRHRKFGIFNNFPLSATLLCLVRYNFVEKDEFLMEYFKLVHAPPWKIPLYMKIYLFICTRHREFGIFNFLRYLRLPKALQGTLFWKKMIFFMKYFKLVHAPT